MTPKAHGRSVGAAAILRPRCLRTPPGCPTPPLPAVLRLPHGRCTETWGDAGKLPHPVPPAILFSGSKYPIDPQPETFFFAFDFSRIFLWFLCHRDVEMDGNVLASIRELCPCEHSFLPRHPQDNGERGWSALATRPLTQRSPPRVLITRPLLLPGLPPDGGTLESHRASLGGDGRSRVLSDPTRVLDVAGGAA